MSRVLEVSLPHEWSTRSYQLPLWKALASGTKRAVAVWHRRAGKDALGIHWTTVAALERVGTYWHMLPTLKQGRLVLWDGITKDGKKVLDAWPERLVAKRRNDEMKLDLINGSVWQVVGSDNYNTLMGANPVGVVFSEFSLADPAAWDFIRPILAENGGWALFLYTPRGPNHGKHLFELAMDTEGWFAERLTVEDTKVLSQEVVDGERRGGMSEEMIRQEFYCSFDAPLVGAYYGEQLIAADDDGRVTEVPHDAGGRVETWWDLGIRDATAIWFVQRIGTAIHLIDYYEGSGEPLAHYVKVLEDKTKPISAGGREFLYGDHWLPHDVKQRESIAGITRQDHLQQLGLRANVVPLHGIDDGIEAVRRTLGRCWFDKKHCNRGIEALRAYRKELDIERRWMNDKEPMFKSKPYHDWSSHAADAFRYGVMAFGMPKKSGGAVEFLV